MQRTTKGFIFSTLVFISSLLSLASFAEVQTAAPTLKSGSYQVVSITKGYAFEVHDLDMGPGFFDRISAYKKNGYECECSWRYCGHEECFKFHSDFVVEPTVWERTVAEIKALEIVVSDPTAPEERIDYGPGPHFAPNFGPVSKVHQPIIINGNRFEGYDLGAKHGDIGNFVDYHVDYMSSGFPGRRIQLANAPTNPLASVEADMFVGTSGELLIVTYFSGPFPSHMVFHLLPQD